MHCSGWFHTEDVGYYEPNGNIYILDRGEHNIKSKNHHYLILEYLITCHPGVCTAAVALMWNASYGERLMALIVRRKESKVQT